MFLVVPEEHKEEVRMKLPANSLWVFGETGGKTAYVNQPTEFGVLPVTSIEGNLGTVASHQ